VGQVVNLRRIGNRPASGPKPRGQMPQVCLMHNSKMF
jgi:hypothetical protein